MYLAFALNLIINYFAGLLQLTKLNLAICPHVNNTDE